MEFGLTKYGVLIIKRGKVVKSEGISMPNGKMIKNIEVRGYKYLVILEANGVKHEKMKDQVKKEYIRGVRNTLKSKLNARNIISAINSRTVSIVRYGAGIISWTKMELEELDRRTRKLMTMYGAHHPKADVDRLYLQRCEGGRGLLGLEDCVQVEVHSLEKYLSTSKVKILKEVSRSRIIENNKYGRSKEEIYKEHREKYEGKPLHGQLIKATEEIRSKKSWNWLKKGQLSKETENTIVAAQDQALCTSNLRNVVYRENAQFLCRVCRVDEERVAHIVSECSILAQEEYKQVKYDNVAKFLHWKLCEKWGFIKAEKWYIHKPEKVLESENCKILWDFLIQTDKNLEHNRPDITLIDKKNKKYILIDPTCLFDTRIDKKEEEKSTNYSDLKYEIAKIWKMRRVEVTPVVIGALGTVTKQLEKWIKKLDLDLTIEALQRPCLLGTTRRIRILLDMK